jgi:heme/copper-type cytochrome/quinol oxidase subunit 2
MAISDNPGGAVPVASISDDNGSYVDWPAIFAGTVLATAISFLLLTFGSAIGLSMTSAYEGMGASIFWFAIVAALWLLWVQLSSFFAGGYLAGRMRRRHGDATEYESDIRDGSHGLIVWALGVLVGAFIAFSGISGALSAASTAIGAAGSTAAATLDAADPNELLVDRMLRGTQPATEPVATNVRDEIGRILVTTLADGELDDGDRQYLVATVAARTGLDEAEAQQRVDQLVERARQLEMEARAAADAARRTAMIAAFITAAALFVSAAAAYFGATLGGNHRDRQTVVVGWYRPW